MTGLQMIADLGLGAGSENLPTLRADQMLAAGSLFMFDSGHSRTALADVPANGAALYNLAWKEAARLTGSGTETTLRGLFTDMHQAADAIFELSGKGGIHSIYSQVNNVNNRGAYITPPAAVLRYMSNNPDHQYYLSQWSRITRQRVTGSAYGYADVRSMVGTSPSGLLIRFNEVGIVPASNGPTYRGSRFLPSTNNLGNVFRAGAVEGWTIDTPEADSETSIRASIVHMGNTLQYGSAATNKSPSQILYRVTLEDLTVSGRTFAQAADQDQALWEAAFGSGGRYAEDTFTDPATFA